MRASARRSRPPTYTDYGVNVDDEMARLIQLQNAYSANARVISTVQDLMNKLLQI